MDDEPPEIDGHFLVEGFLRHQTVGKFIPQVVAEPLDEDAAEVKGDVCPKDLF